LDNIYICFLLSFVVVYQATFFSLLTTFHQAVFLIFDWKKVKKIVWYRYPS